MAEFEELDCACAGIVGEDNPEIGPESIDVLVEVIRELHHKKKILDDRDCKTIRNSGARVYKCYFELTFALLAKRHEKVKTAIKVLHDSKDPVIVTYIQIPQFLNVCLALHKPPDHEDVEQMKRRHRFMLKERIIHVVCKKDFAAVKDLANVMGIYDFPEEKDWLLVYLKLHEERVLTDEDVQNLKKMTEPLHFLQRIWTLLGKKDPDTLRKAGDIVRRNTNHPLIPIIPLLAHIQEKQYLSREEYSSIFDYAYDPLGQLIKVAIAKDSDTNIRIAAVLRKHDKYLSQLLLALAEIVAEKCLTLKKCRHLLDVHNKYETETLWSRAAAGQTDAVRKQISKILVAKGLTEEAEVVRRRETVGGPMPPPQPGHGTVGAPRPPPHPERANESTEDEALGKLKPSFVVMTANDNEYAAAHQYLEQSAKDDPSLKDVEKPENVSSSPYKVFKVAGKQGILMQCTNMGSFTFEGSNWHTFKLLNEAKKYHWPLDVIFIVGCCGAHAIDGNNIPEGTILLAKVIEQYLIGKKMVGGVQYEPHPHVIETKSRWIEFIQQSKVCKSDPNYTIEAFEKVHMCSGDFVIKDDEIARQLCGSRNKMGFEMEGLGVIAAINVYKNFFRSDNEKIPDVVLVKGVSDNAGGDKNKPKNCLYFSNKVADADEDTRQRKCTEMSLTLVLRAMIREWKEQ